MKCRELMLPHVFTCQQDDSALHAATLMRDSRAGMVVVVDPQQRLVGLVTDRDLVVRVIAENRPLTTPLSQVMTRGPFVTFDPDEELTVLEQRLREGRVFRAVALDARGRPAGVISLSDLAKSDQPERTARVVQEVIHRQAADPGRM